MDCHGQKCGGIKRRDIPGRRCHLGIRGEIPALAGTPLDAQVAAASGDIPAFDPTAFLAGNGSPLTMLEDFANRGDAMAATFKQEAAIETTMKAFLGIAWSLSGIPGKKSVISGDRRYAVLPGFSFHRSRWLLVVAL